jgi:hypothetical protein
LQLTKATIRAVSLLAESGTSGETSLIKGTQAIETALQGIKRGFATSFRRSDSIIKITPPKRVSRRAVRKAAKLDRIAKRAQVPYAEEMSEWDPIPSCLIHIDSSRCRALLLEILRRAAHDWVLYRMSTRLKNKQLAEDAYTWLFEEKKDHPYGIERLNSGQHLTSFLSICELLDLDPKTVRTRVREMTVRDVMCAGRPAERRRKRRKDDVTVTDHAVSGVDIASISDDGGRTYVSKYEAHYATNTLSYA